MTDLPVLNEYVRRFHDYARPFAENAGEGRETVVIKIDHTSRVFDLASQIANMENLQEEDTAVARLAALFHDTGRFPQFAKYGVFSDRTSENHASLGVKALIRENLLDGLAPEHKRTILGAVFLHNVRNLPGGLPRQLDTVTRIVRDADKLDIMPVMFAHLKGTGTMNKAVTMGIKADPDKVSPAILEQLHNRQICNYQDMQWQNDFKLLVLSWIYDLNYKASYRLLDQRGHFQEIMDTLPRTAELEHVRQLVQEELSAKLSLP